MDDFELVPQESMLVPQEPILENVIFNYMHGWIMYAEDVSARRGLRLPVGVQTGGGRDCA